MDQTLSPSNRIEQMWHALFLVRLWRNFVLNQAGLTLRCNFLSIFSYYCIELNAHSLVQIITYLRNKNLSHLFLPYLFCSHPCVSFYRQIRSLSTVNSTVTNCSTKEFLHRISRIEILNQISNDKDSGFIF